MSQQADGLAHGGPVFLGVPRILADKGGELVAHHGREGAQSLGAEGEAPADAAQPLPGAEGDAAGVHPREVEGGDLEGARQRNADEADRHGQEAELTGGHGHSPQTVVDIRSAG